MPYKYDKEQIQARATGRWFEIFQALEPRLNEAIEHAGYHVPCPAGTGSRDGFRLANDSNTDGHAFHNQVDNRKLSDGFGVLMWLNNWRFTETLERVHNYLEGKPDVTYSALVSTAPDDESWKRKAKALERMLEHSTSTANDAVRAYYHNRGIDNASGISSPSLRYHKGVSIFYRGQTIKNASGWVTVPAIIGRMSNSQGWTGAQIIRLTRSGHKATDFMRDAIEQATGSRPGQLSNKQMLKSAPSMTGSAVRFGKAESTLCAGEGLESMLAVALALETLSVASAGTAALLAGLEVPPQVNRLLIFADKDRPKELPNGRLVEPGLDAAEKLRDRMKDRMDVEILLPPSQIPPGAKSVDWLDDIEALKTGKLDLWRYPNRL